MQERYIVPPCVAGSNKAVEALEGSASIRRVLRRVTLESEYAEHLAADPTRRYPPWYLNPDACGFCEWVPFKQVPGSGLNRVRTPFPTPDSDLQLGAVGPEIRGTGGLYNLIVRRPRSAR